MIQAADRVHFTHLKAMNESPAHYQASVEVGFEREGFGFGRLVHYLTLLPKEAYERAFVVWDHKDKSGEKLAPRNGKVWEAFKEAANGLDIFTSKEVAEAHVLAAAVKNDPVVRRLGLLNPANDTEKLIDWNFAGVPFRSHLDILGVTSSGRRFVADLKTTQSAKPDRFRWEARRLHYHAQLATYEKAAESIGRRVDDALIIAVEKSVPYAVTVFLVTPALLEEGSVLTRKWLELYRVCAKADQWPGYTQDVETIDVRSLDDAEPLMLTMADGSEVAA